MHDTFAFTPLLFSRAVMITALFLCIPHSSSCQEPERKASQGDPYKAYGSDLSPQEAQGLEFHTKGEKQLKEALRKMVNKESDWADLSREASENFSKAIALIPNEGRPYKKKTEALIYLKEFQEADAAGREALKRGESGVNKLLAKANLELKEYDQAAHFAMAATREDPNDAQAFAWLAHAYYMKGMDSDGLENIRKAAELDPRAYEDKYLRAKKEGSMFSSRAGMDDSVPQEDSSSPLAILVGGCLLVFLAIVGGVFYRIFFNSKEEESVTGAGPRSAPVEGTADEKLLSGKYEMKQVIGKGGMGHVWEALDHSLNRKVAIKKMTQELGELGSTARKYYLQEARTVASLDHPHIIGIYEILDLPSGIYLVFELAVGKTVQHILAEEKRMTLPKVVSILGPVCDALDFAHSRGFVHRDLKPANLIITEQGFVKVMDFGIARRIDERVDVMAGTGDVPEGPKGILMARTRTLVGTPQYMPPEANQGIVSPLTDIYTLGICCYEMLTGRLPYAGLDLDREKLKREYAPATQRVPGLPAGLDDLIHQTVDPDTNSRVQSAREFAQRLAVLGGSA